MEIKHKYKVKKIGIKTKIYLISQKFNKDGEFKKEESKLIAGFNYIKAVTGPVLDWKGNNLNNREQLEIELFDVHKEEKVRKKIFDMNDFNSQQLYNFIKIQGAPPLSNVDNIMELFYDKEISKNENKIVKKSRKKFSEIFGINAKGDLILPNDYELSNKELYENDKDFKSFVDIQSKETISPDELKRTINVIYRYLLNDDYSKIVFAYAFASVFRLYLMEDKGLRLFPYLMMISQSPNKGKSTTAKILVNSIFLGYDANISESSKITKGSIKRILEKQYASLPLYIDEFTDFGENDEVFKELATQSIFDINMSYGNSIKNYNIVLRRGGIIASTNKLSREITDALRDRSLLLNFEEREEYEGLDDDVDYLIKNAHKVSKILWENMLEFKQEIKLTSNKRANAKLEVLNVGMQLVNSFFSKFDKEPLKLDTKAIIENEERLIATENDKTKAVIYKEILRLTRRPTGADIFSIPQLTKNIVKHQQWVDGYEFDYREANGNLRGAYDDHNATTNRNVLRTLELDYRRIIDDGIKYGIYINNDGIVLTKTFLIHMKTYYPNEFSNIQTLPNLMNIFLPEEISYASSSAKSTMPVIKKIYGIDESQGNISYDIIDVQLSGLLWKKKFGMNDLENEE